MARPLLMLVLVFIGVVCGAAAVGYATGQFDVAQILTGAVGQLLGGVIDAAISFGQGVADWFFSRLSDALNPI